MITISEYTSIFRFRSDTYARQQEDGSYKRISRRLTLEDLKDHIINHTKVLALYPSIKGKCFLGAIDLDIPHGESDSPEAWREMENQIKSILEQLVSLGVGRSVLTEKTGGRGYHIWVFSQELPVTRMYDFLKQVIDSVGVDAEIFPIDTIENGIGRGIRPPLGTHLLYNSSSFFVDQDFNKLELTSNIIEDIDNHKITKEDLNRLGIPIDDMTNYQSHSLDYNDIPKSSHFDEVYDELRPCFQAIYDNKIETTGGEGWSFMTAAAAEIMANGGRDEDVHTYFSVQEQYTKRKTSKHLRPIKRKNLMPFTCDKLMERCSKYVIASCDGCRIQKQQNIYQELEIAVDKTQGKEERTLGGVRETIEQFQYVANDIQDILTQDEYTVILNGFNTGKTWSTIAMMKNIIGEGGRVNFVAHTKKIKKIVAGRLKKAGVGFLDNPNNLELCPRASEFVKLGYVPSAICKGCEKRVTIRELLKPLMDDYITGDLPFFGTLSRYEKIAEEYNTCAKWVYLSLLMSTQEENLVILMTDAKVKHHLFIPDSPFIPILKSGTLFCTLIDQIDYINRKIPKITISDLKTIKNMRKLGILDASELTRKYAEISQMLENGDITPEGLDELQAAEEIKQWIYLNEEYNEGRMRRLYNVRQPELKTYDIMGIKPMKIIMNDIFAKRINPRLYDKTIEYLRDLRIECITTDGENRVPLSFREIMEEYSDNSAILGITSTPTDIEIASSKWWTSSHDSKKNILNNLYQIPIGSDVMDGSDIDGRTIIYSRKNDGDYINDGEVRGNTQLGGSRDNTIVESLQYPRNSEEAMSDLIQLCGGNMGKGTKVFYQGVVSDALTQAAKYESDRVYIPNPELFTALGFNISKDDSMEMKIWRERVLKKFSGKDQGLYRHQIKSVPDDILEKMIENDFLKMDGKKYILIHGTA